MFPEVHERHCGLSGDTATCLLNHALQPECLKGAEDMLFMGIWSDRRCCPIHVPNEPHAQCTVAFEWKAGLS